jgi:hypothetical protein
VADGPIDHVAVVQIADARIDVVAVSAGQVHARDDRSRALDLELRLEGDRLVLVTRIERRRAAVDQKQRNRKHLLVAGLVPQLGLANIARYCESIRIR